MTTQEAIKIIRNEHCGRCDGKFICNGCYIGKAIESLEKQAGIERALERLEDYNMWKELLIYDLTYREREIVKKAIEIITEEVG